MPEDAVRIDILLDEERDAEKRLKSVERQSKRTFRSFEKDAKRGERAGKRFGSILGGLKGQVLALAGGVGLAQIARTSVQNFMVQERAVMRLDAALEVMGMRLPGVRSEMEEYAAALQKVTIHGDEALISGMALAVSMGASTDQAKELVEQAANLSAAFDKDLNETIRQMAKSLGGFAGELGEILPEMKDLTRDQLRGGGVIGVVRSRFGGMAARVADSESGKFIQMLNDFGDRLEPVGKRILEGLNLLADGFEGAHKSFADKDSLLGKAFRMGSPYGMVIAEKERREGQIARAVNMPPEVAAALKAAKEADAIRAGLFEDVNNQLRASGLAMFPAEIGDKALHLMREAFDKVTPKQVAALIEQARTPEQRFTADMAFLGDLKALVGRRDDYATMHGQPESGLESSVDKMMRDRELAHVFEENPIVTNFAQELGASVQFSLADAINVGFRQGGQAAIDTFALTLGDAVLTAVAENLAAGLVSEAGLGEFINTGLVDLFGNAAAVAGGP